MHLFFQLKSAKSVRRFLDIDAVPMMWSRVPLLYTCAVNEYICVKRLLVRPVHFGVEAIAVQAGFVGENDRPRGLQRKRG